jgi:hypothetical protein
MYRPTAYNPTLHKYQQRPYFQQPYDPTGRANPAWEGKTKQYGDDTAFQPNIIESGVNEPTNESEELMFKRVKETQSRGRSQQRRRVFDEAGMNSRSMLLQGLIS